MEEPSEIPQLDRALAAAYHDARRLEDLLELLKWTPVLVPLPGYAGEGPLVFSQGEPIRFPDVDFEGHAGIPAYTSTVSLRAGWPGAHEDRIAPFTGLQLAVLWPESAQSLLLNPGVSLGTAIPADDVRGLQYVLRRLGPRPLDEKTNLRLWDPATIEPDVRGELQRFAAASPDVVGIRYAVARVERRRDPGIPYVVLGIELADPKRAPVVFDALVAALARLPPPAFALWPLTDPPVDTVAAWVAAHGTVVV
jgi:hypothetical protein